MDWSSQPEPFRRYHGAECVALDRELAAEDLPFDSLYGAPGVAPAALGLRALADFLRHSLAISAWKELRGSRWALRVNPSSGNLHPTECYVLGGPELFGEARVTHYNAEQHILEIRARIPARLWDGLAIPPGAFLLVISSVYWREAWKYGERAFRYCQHDAGHALAALRFSAALLGWRLRWLGEWADEVAASLAGLDQEGFAEREAPEFAAVVSAGPVIGLAPPDEEVLMQWRQMKWLGAPNRLSERYVAWPFIDEVDAATRREAPVLPTALPVPRHLHRETIGARAAVLQRRSAVAFDGRTSLTALAFQQALERTLPCAAPPWDALAVPALLHLAVFVHRVDGLERGLYMLVRAPHAIERLQRAMRAEFEWRRCTTRDDLPLYLLWRGDFRRSAAAISCEQDIAGDSAFSLGMIAEYEGPLRAVGPDLYRRLFWEAGMIGQVLYLEAEAAGVRATGIGCYFDDSMHELLGLHGRELQSLYHFTVGGPVEGRRLRTMMPYGVAAARDAK
jgi:SagB-type dehydrogenase family enzyme